MMKEIRIGSRRRRPQEAFAAPKRESGPGDLYYSKSIGRALDVLESFSDERPSLSLTDIGALLHLPSASLFRILVMLESRGYLTRNTDGAYQLSRKVLFGKILERAEKLISLARPELQRLANRFNESAALAYLFEDRLQVLDVVESFHEMRITNKPGRLLPPHCSALGKAIAAFQHQPLMDRILEVYGLTRRTDNTIVDRGVLLEEFEKIRAKGYSVDREETTPGAICFGTPVRMGSGGVVASLSLSSPIIRITSKREQEIIRALLDSARKLSRSSAGIEVVI
jgi:DNA-binding IclR family transcriptional regulator